MWIPFRFRDLVVLLAQELWRQTFKKPVGQGR